MKLSPQAEMTELEFRFFADLIFHRSGIKMNNSKKMMIQTRLLKRLNKLSLKNFQEYIHYIKSHPEEGTNFVNSLTTNKTDFFREIGHFNYLKSDFLPEIVQKYPSGRKVMIWSAACSSGPEPYTLGMIMNEFCNQNKKFTYSILATDIDTTMIQKAKEGIYNQELINGVPQNYFLGNITKVKDRTKGEVQYKVSDKLKANISFREFNLTSSQHVLPIKYDIIFLRNVLIYFESDMIQKIIDRVTKYLGKGGILILGHSESLMDIKHNLKLLKMSMYRKEL